MKVHIAGFPVRVGSRLRQLCAWCGEQLIDLDLDCIAVAPGSSVGAPGTWETNALVAVDGPVSWVVQPEDGDKLPRECCAKGPVKLTLVEGG